MKLMTHTSIRFGGEYLEILDQTVLPQKESWLVMRTPEDMIEAIVSLRVRGAPLIGVSAALFLSQHYRRNPSTSDFLQIATRLREARPTAVNLMHCMDQMIEAYRQSPDSVVERGWQLFEEDQKLCQSIGQFGAGLIESGFGILTHCNTGALATAGRGTALGVIQTAHEQGKKIHVYVDETRPLLQGGRLTAWELEKLQIPYTLICDNMAARLMKDGKIQCAIVGADRIAMNGDFANKTGTYSVAVACQYHGIPFYTAAPLTTLDFECESGEQIPIEQRPGFEVQGVRGAFGEVNWSPLNAPTYNPAFDVTPAELVKGWVLDTGYYDRESVQAGSLRNLKN